MYTITLLNKALKNYRKMIKDPDEATHFVAGQQEIISRHSRDKRVLDFVPEIELSLSLRIHGTWRGIVGSVRVADGDLDGWNDLYLCYLYRAWGLRSEVANKSRMGKIKGFLLRDGYAETLAHAIVLGDDGYADWLGNLIISSYQNKDGSFTNDPYRTHFEPFVVQLFAMKNRIEFDISRYRACNFGVYRHVIEKWSTSDEYLADAFLAACEYHCDPSGFGEYANVPYLNFPVEILAAIAVRKKLGLPVPEIPHPLLQAPLGRFPPKSSPNNDPILEGAIKKIRETHPEIGHPW
jgi:hypothetical protein